MMYVLLIHYNVRSTTYCYGVVKCPRLGKIAKCSNIYTCNMIDFRLAWCQPRLLPQLNTCTCKIV